MRHFNKTLTLGFVVLGFVFAFILTAMPEAHADPTGAAIESKTKKAMDEYDMMEFEAAKSLLSEAIAMGEQKGVKGPELATAYVSLGIVLFSGLDEAAEAGQAFLSAVGINAEVSLDVAYSTPELVKLLSLARAEVSGGGSCIEDGLEHQLVDEAARGSMPEIKASLGTNVEAENVFVFYRGEGQLAFSKMPMKKTSDCAYVGRIPRGALKGDFVHYYVAALDAAGKEIERKGSSGSPNIIEVAAASGGSLSSSDENPLNGKKSLLGTDKKSVFFSVGVGTGTGYVSGPTEKLNRDVECCLAPALLHVMPELGYYISEAMSVSIAFRMGFPVGANVEGHATFAPAGLVRLRYGLGENGQGLQVSGVLGGGIIRNTVVVDQAPSDMNTDTTAMGPVLFGGGLGYILSLGGPMRLVAEVNAMAAVTAGFDELGPCPDDGCVRPTNGAQIDANLAVLFAF